MPLVEMVRPDTAKIGALISQWYRQARQDPGGPALQERRGAISHFARSLREPPRHPQSFWNMNAGKLISLNFAEQIAAKLGVDVADILLPETAASETPRPQTGAEAA